MGKVKIETKDDSMTDVYLDDKWVSDSTTEVHLDLVAGQEPEIKIIFNSFPDCLVDGDVKISYDQETAKHASKIVCDEIKNNDEVHAGLVQNIADTLDKNNLPFADSSEIAEKILKNLVGED